MPVKLDEEMRALQELTPREVEAYYRRKKRRQKIPGVVKKLSLPGAIIGVLVGGLGLLNLALWPTVGGGLVAAGSGVAWLWARSRIKAQKARAAWREARGDYWQT